MGLLVIELLIGVVLGGIFFVVGMFIGQIILFESILLGIVLGMVASKVWHIHTFFAILIGIGACFLLFILQNTTPGFWIIGGIFSIAWGGIFALFAYDASDKDPIWTYGIWITGALVVMLLHRNAKVS